MKNPLTAVHPDAQTWNHPGVVSRDVYVPAPAYCFPFPLGVGQRCRRGPTLAMRLILSAANRF